MSARLEELDYQQTEMGELMLRRRRELTLGVDIYEVKLGDEYLMSSLFTVAEEELARLGLAAVANDVATSQNDASGPAGLRVLVGGLGLGYTAVTALDDPRVASLTVIDALGPVIDWHQRGLLPVSRQLVDDSRTSLVLGDFFAIVRAEPASDSPPYDVILLDIDHSTQHQLDPSHAELYTTAGLRALARHLRPGGVFALWSDDPPYEPFMAELAAVFTNHSAHVVEFDNPLTGGTSTNSVYLATV